jgi:hypothetical protein
MGAIQSCEKVSILQTSDVNSTDGQNDYRFMECMIRRWGLTPLACIGVVLNILAMWVWTAERGFKTLTLFFKCLAVFDTFYLILYTVKSFALTAESSESPKSGWNIFIVFANMVVFTTTCLSVYQY